VFEPLLIKRIVFDLFSTIIRELWLYFEDTCGVPFLKQWQGLFVVAISQ
jgi:hypothetical protein